ncbi:MAG: septum formation initiator family protein [Alphaproteobacteria bacterium]
MSWPIEIAQRARSMAGPLAVACIVSYIGFHAIQGERGLLTWLQLSYQIEQTREALVMSRAEEQPLAHRVSLLRRDNLDLDMLDERVRAVLNQTRPGEFVMFVEPARPTI